MAARRTPTALLPSLGLMDTLIFRDVVVVLVLSVMVLFLFTRLRLPSIVGLLVTGTLVGPYGPGLIRDTARVEELAEIGVVLLLFTIGLEFSLSGLARLRRSVLLGGSLQCLLTIAAGYGAGLALGLPQSQAVFLGFLLSLSSTAIVMRLLQQRYELETPHGRTTLSILIYQDLAVVGMMLLVPVLGGGGEDRPVALPAGLAGLAVAALLLVAAAWLIPRLLHQVVRTRSRELFLLVVVALCAAIAWLTSSVGLSLALGAFLAGLIISESPYGHQALGDVLPFREVFTSFFFVSIGMLLDVRFLAAHLGLILLLTLGVLVVKSLLAGGSGLLLGMPLRTAALVGLALGQVGEFAFVLSRSGTAHGLLTGDAGQVFLAVSVLTMAVTPWLVALAPRWAQVLTSLPWPPRLLAGWYPLPSASAVPLENHLLIVGYGLNGRNVARAARSVGIPYHILEMNPDTVRLEQAQGEAISYGDATSLAVLQGAGIERASALVVAIADPAATRRIVELARRLCPDLYLIARTRLVEEVPALYALGADEVVPEEFETAVGIFARVLEHYRVAPEESERAVAELRADGYGVLRGPGPPHAGLCDLRATLPEAQVRLERLAPDSPLAGLTLAEADLRRRQGVTVLAVRRGDEAFPNPSGDFRLQPGDLLVLLDALYPR